MLMVKINVAEWVSRKISLFGKMQRGRSPSFELFQLDMKFRENIGSQYFHEIFAQRK